ncbi:MAG TPA: response regulator transcription factor [Acidimicrobiales bacterium]|nr:response regulator transcription factor [Acidimicrobiales bacterium]
MSIDTATRLRVVVVDSHPATLAGLSRVITRAADVELVGAAASSSQAEAMVCHGCPDVLLLDYRVVDLEGSESLQRLLLSCANTSVVLLKGIGDHDLLARAVDTGSAGVLAKNSAAGDVLAAIRLAASGAVVVRCDQFWGMLEWLPRSAGQHARWLSEQERTVLELLIREYSEEGIANELLVTRSTVRCHVDNILTKLGARSKLEAVLLAVRASASVVGHGRTSRDHPVHAV